MRKNNKRALILSCLSLLLCVSMLVGVTFAWFTDTASTAVNTIQSGTLDVDLVDADGNTLVGQTLDFVKAANGAGQTILWEPGCTYSLPEVYVANKGNLALKYKVGITGINGAAKLNEAIEWTIQLEGKTVAVDTEFTLAPGAKSSALTITGHMKEEAGNEYQGLSIDGVGITVYATQVAGDLADFAEYDSSDNMYDKLAQYPVITLPPIDAPMVKDETAGVYTYVNSDKTVTASIDVAGVPKTAAEGAPSVVIVPTDTVDEGTKIESSEEGFVAYDISMVDAAGNPFQPTEGHPATVSFTTTAGLKNVVVYHKGVAMTKSDTLPVAVDHYNYDASTGVVTVCVSSFSNFAVVFDLPEAIIGDVAYNTVAEALAAANGNEIILMKNVTISGGDNEVLGTADNTLININANGRTITFANASANYAWTYLTTANPDAVLSISNAKITRVYNNVAHYNTFLSFACNTNLTNVEVDQSINLLAYGNVGKTFNLKNVTINDGRTDTEHYAMFIEAGNTVTIDGCVINNGGAGNRAIKIVDEYAKCLESVNLTVKNTKFTSEKKAAIQVGTACGANITLENIDISGVAADTVNAVWVDEEYATNYDKVTVTGGNKVLEPGSKLKDSATKAMLSASGTVDFNGAEAAYVNSVNIKASTVSNMNSNGIRYGYLNGNTTFENCTFTASSDGRAFHIDGVNSVDTATLVFKNCTFKGWTAITGDVTNVSFVNCTFADGATYNFINCYLQDMTFTNCTFESNFGIDDESEGTQTWTFTSCTGVPETLNATGTYQTVTIVKN